MNLGSQYFTFQVLKMSYQIEGRTSQVVDSMMAKESLLKVQGSQTVMSNKFLLAQMLGSTCGQMPAGCLLICPQKARSLLRFLHMVQVVQPLMQLFE